MKYKYDQWVNGDVTLVSVYRIFLSDEDKGRVPRLAKLSDFSSEDQEMIILEQQQILNEHEKIVDRAISSLLDQKMKAAPDVERTLQIEINECDKLMNGHYYKKYLGSAQLDYFHLESYPFMFSMNELETIYNISRRLLNGEDILDEVPCRTVLEKSLSPQKHTNRWFPVAVASFIIKHKRRLEVEVAALSSNHKDIFRKLNELDFFSLPAIIEISWDTINKIVSKIVENNSFAVAFFCESGFFTHLDRNIKGGMNSKSRVAEILGITQDTVKKLFESADKKQWDGRSPDFQRKYHAWRHLPEIRELL